MSAEHTEPRPANRPRLVGHGEAEAAIRAAIDSNRLAHGWLIAGPRGIGKATLAFRFARFLLAPPDQRGAGLQVAPETATFRQVARGAHGGLRLLEREVVDDDRKKAMEENVDPRKLRRRTIVTVDQARSLDRFFGLTAAYGGWRVAIVDSVDDMNPNAANALLKNLEEPPERSVLILVSHAPGGLLPTIRSRCRLLTLRPLADAAVVEVLREQQPDLAADAAEALARLADGSPGLAAELAGQGGVAAYASLVDLLTELPRVDYVRVHALADRLSRRGAEGEAEYRLWTTLVPLWLTRLVRGALAGDGAPEAAPGEAALARRLAAGNLDRWVDVWEKITRLVSRADAVNLDRKQAVLAMFLALEQAAGA